MKLVIMGEGPFAVPILRELAAAGYEIPLVVATAKDGKNAESGAENTLTGVAHELQIPVISPSSIDDETMKTLNKVLPDIIICASYDKILSHTLLHLPQFGCLGVHPSLLPRWRGLHPVEHALAAGDEKVGISIFYMEDRVDAGPIISKTSLPVLDRDAEHLYLEASYLGAQMLNLALQTLLFSVVRPEYQDEELATY